MNEVRSPEQIERHITDLRAQISNTLDAVQQKLSPGQLLDQALSYAKDGGTTFAANFGRGVRDNPVPAALLGISLGWLIYASMREPRTIVEHGSERQALEARGDGRTEFADSGYDPLYDGGSHAADYHGTHDTHFRSVGAQGYSPRSSSSPSSGDGSGKIAGRAHDIAERGRGILHRAGDAGHRVGERASQLTDSARERLRGAGDYARESLSRTRSEAMHARDATVDFVKNNPLAVTAAALMAGALIGALLPRTRREDRLMGEQRDRVMDGVKEAASEEANHLVEDIHDATDSAFRAGEDTLNENAKRD